jgi:hypothetical protein
VNATFEVIVGRPWDRGAQACEDTMRAQLRERSSRWLRRETNATPAEVAAAADRIVADQLPADRLGVQTVALTADQLRIYLRLTQEAAQ